jgi:hypothetical protein
VRISGRHRDDVFTFTVRRAIASLVGLIVKPQPGMTSSVTECCDTIAVGATALGRSPFSLDGYSEPAASQFLHGGDDPSTRVSER